MSQMFTKCTVARVIPPGNDFINPGGSCPHIDVFVLVSLILLIVLYLSIVLLSVLRYSLLRFTMYGYGLSFCFGVVGLWDKHFFPLKRQVKK